VVKDLKDSNGNYLKTVCTVYLNYNQLSARVTCAAYGMLLYRFNTAEDEKALLDYSDDQWPYNRLWVEGGNTTRGQMVSNQELSSFEKISMPPVVTYNYFYCEYKSECSNHEGFIS
jgi:hypothetical protein